MRYSQEQINIIKKYLDYSPDSPTGLIWIDTPYRVKNKIGDTAGYIETSKYSRVGLLGKRYQTTHCIMIIKGHDIGEKEEIDHLDGNPLNNLYENLRIVDHQTNMQNKKKDTRNQFNFTGITHHEATNRVSAYFNLNGKQFAKYFGIKKYGLEGAVRKAKEWRLSKIKELTENYTERHIFN